MTVWTKNQQICFYIISFICILMMSFKNIWKFIITTNLAFFKINSRNAIRRLLFSYSTSMPSTTIKYSLSSRQECFPAFEAFLFLWPLMFLFIATFTATSELFRTCWNCFKILSTHFANFLISCKYFSPSISEGFFGALCTTKLSRLSKFYSARRTLFYENFSFVKSCAFSTAKKFIGVFTIREFFSTLFTYLHKKEYNINASYCQG